ncbi:hypothetical protein [Treponema sp.]|uniref:hypothetical protein n=1 Tax=Treponema sp. TaxID=166 RepID=UPI0025D6DF0C|nr:hypothetical protein [Treponema sp.]MCR5217246.1 hypothetical protein [Treponema sp.]
MPFTYKAGNSFLHKMPAWCKILFIPLLNIFVFKMPFYVAASFLIIQFILALCLKFTIKEQLKDFSPIIIYAFLLYITAFFSRWAAGGFLLNKAPYIARHTFTNASTGILLLKLFSIIQSASLVFRTSTSLQIREGVGAVESAVRKVLPCSKKNKFTNTLSLFICFIPMVFKNWNQCRRAWFARKGPRGIKMYAALFPVFFSVGIKQAWNASRAITIREG